MNKNKFSFITCVTDQDVYQESLYYISQLKIPENLEVECISIDNPKSIAMAYNEAMAASDAKYKVYLHQDVFIINKGFIEDCINLFNSDSNIGMIGMVGAKAIPTSGIWKDSKHKYGKVFKNHSGFMKEIVYNDIEGLYNEVDILEGFIMITQYDIPWRNDVFNDLWFYDAAQSIEFKRAGYKAVIPNISIPWCIHDCGAENVDNRFEEYRKSFINTYYRDMYPLVSILIPTYNRPDYFKIALDSAINQTYKNIEVIIGDDSTNNETEELVKKHYLNKYPNITYYHNERNLGQFDNDLKLMDMCKGEYVNFLMDDDLFELTKIEKMMSYFINDIDREIALITSHRGIIDEKGNNKGLFGDTDSVFKTDTIIHGTELADFVIANNYNCIGEPTTVLFRKSMLIEPFGVFNDRKYECNVDQASWFNLLSQGKAIFIAEILSYFRIHDNQQLGSTKMKLLGAVDYIHEVLTANQKGFLQKNEEYLKALRNSQLYSESVMREYQPDEKDGYKNEYNQLQDIYKQLNEELKRTSNSEGISRKDLPLVSILIPAYNQTKYLKEALESAINQTYSNIEIIIGDDSTTNVVEEFIKPYLSQYSNITYFRNQREEMDYGLSNVIRLMAECKGEYINFLFHDDVFHITKIEKMMKFFTTRRDISLVTSHRQLIDEEGKFLPDNGATQRLFDKDTIIDGHQLSLFCLENLTNFIGEPSTVLFKRTLLDEGFGFINGHLYLNISDLSTWIALLKKGNAVYISESLSYFREHNSQNSKKNEIYLIGICNWKEIIDACYKMNIINTNMEYINLLSKWFKCFSGQLNELKFKYIKSHIRERLNLAFSDAINKIIEDKQYPHKCVICSNDVEKFVPYRLHVSESLAKYNIIGSDVENFSCPICGGHDRERHLVMYFNELKIWEKIYNRNILHIAPEDKIKELVKKHNPNNYIQGDLFPNKADIIRIDITSIQFEDETFDVIICNHVLEHIIDDLAAMKELYRVLKKGGIAILQTPYSPLLKDSFEDEKITKSEDRLKYFGQEDHVRIYGLDFFDRLKRAGFQLNIISNDEIFNDETCIEYGVNPREDLILATKM
ncbi:glycosyltransferase [Alkaliphilus serpentinus]|uniref:Glycosyltransferase n=1 Tax=Alkaliphilus serpentinus TaxID=1482731 RepID=A0A833HLV1_9FIRM|nr:glycosyltransferase [Alkaliphilus serpentinus]KAB3526640.1 glycosyltransferase [Alkaliphilus serpentinus]